jgi:conjugative relaxase-like TrwC/TraI family protein
MGLHKLTAGDGYLYLLRQVAASDGTDLGRASLADYYSEKGETPGQWIGHGLEALGRPVSRDPHHPAVQEHWVVPEGSQVREDQMKALFGEGLHPNADDITKYLSGVGLGQAGCHAAAKLGRPFRVMANENEYLRRMRSAYAEYNAALGLSANASIEPEVRADIRTAMGRAMFTETHGRKPANDRELTGFLARHTRSQTTAVAGYDLTFTPVKSFSTLWALAPLPVAEKLLDCHHRAVADALAFLEQEAWFARMGTNGIAQVDATGLIAAAFDHRDSRAGDPNPHTHVAVSNKVHAIGPDGIGRWLALDGQPLYKATVAASELYNTQLEAYTIAELGVNFAATDTKVGKRQVREIVGVPTELTDLWSSRRAAIEHRVGELAKDFQAQHHREPTAIEMIALSQQATLDTRHAKHAARSLAEQRHTWRTEAIETLGSQHAVDAAISTILSPAARRQQHIVTDEWITEQAAAVIARVSAARATWAVNHVRAETQRVLRQTDHVGDQSVARRIIGVALDVHSVARTSHADTEMDEPCALRRRDGSSIYTHHDNTVYTSEEILAAERRILAAAALSGGHVVDGDSIATALAERLALDGVDLNDGQVTLLRDMATSGARCQLALAPAGTGKTTAAAGLASAWITSGGTVIGLAPTAAAAEVLAADLGAPTDTIDKLVHLAGLGGGPAPAVDDPARRWFDTIDENTLIIVDEAGMASTLGLDAVITHALATGASIRLIGDDKQLASVSAGGVLRDIAEEHGALALADVVRFTDPLTGAAEGAASLALREGDPTAIAFYLDHDRVHVGAEHAVTDVAYQAWADAQADGRDALMIAPTNDLVAELNSRARLDRLRREQPSDNTRTVTLADGLEASVGDWIITRNNARWLHIPGGGWVKNGHRWVIRDIDDNGTVSVSRLTGSNTESVVRLPARYVTSATTLGYARTINGAQGATARHECHVVGTDRLTREQLYVALTRGKAQNHIYFSTSEADPHAVLAPKATHPPTATDIMAAILRRTGAQVSAHTAARIDNDPFNRVARAGDMYLDALTRGAETLAGPVVMAAIDAAAHRVRLGLTECEAWPVLRRDLALLALDGHDPIDALTHAAAGSLDDAIDPAAVLDSRLPRPAGSVLAELGPLPWLPAIPDAVAADPRWGPYLARRAGLATELADQVRATARSWTAATAPPWARGLFAHNRIPLMAEIAVFRAAHHVDMADSRVTGPNQHTARSRDYQRLIVGRLDTSMRRDHPGVARWHTLAERIDPAITADPFWPRLATHLDEAARAGADIPALLAEAITTHGALPIELPAAALWWRLAGTLAPATLQRSNTGLRPPWTAELHRILGSTIAETIVADPGWPSLVAAVTASDWAPEQLLDTAAEHLLDLLADGSDIRPDEYTRLLTYRAELLTHHAARLDRDVSHTADDIGQTLDEPPLHPGGLFDGDLPPDPRDYTYGYADDDFGVLDFDSLLTERPPAPTQHVAIDTLRARRAAARARADALEVAIIGGPGGPAEQAAAPELAALYARHQIQRPYLADLAHTHADWVHADAIAEAHRYRLAHLDTLARDADHSGDTALADSYRDRHQHLGADTPAIDLALTHAATARDDAHTALLAVAGGPDRIVTENQMHARRLEALQADAVELNAARVEARDLDNQLWRAEASAARAFAAPRTAPGLDVDVSRLQAEVDYLDSAGGVSGAGMYDPPADRYASVPEADRQAVAAVAWGAQSVQVLTIGADADKTAALTAIATAARTNGKRILALPATDTAKNFFDAHPYADGANTPQVAHDKFSDGRWTAPPGTLIVVDDADHLTTDQLHCFTENAVRTNTKLLLVTTPGAEREPTQTLVDTLATNLPWAQHIGTPTDRTPRTAIEQARHQADTNPELGDPTNRQQTRDLLARADTLTRIYTQRLSHRLSHRSTERSQVRDTGLEL